MPSNLQDRSILNPRSGKNRDCDQNAEIFYLDYLFELGRHDQPENQVYRRERHRWKRNRIRFCALFLRSGHKSLGSFPFFPSLLPVNREDDNLAGLAPQLKGSPKFGIILIDNMM